MEMDLEKQVSDTQLINQLNDDGYIIVKNFFNSNTLNTIQKKCEKVFKEQFNRFGYNLNNDFLTNMILLFNEHEDVFINCGKIIQTGLIELYTLSVNENLIKLIKNLGITTPNMCTRPVLYFNHPKLAKEEHYYKTPPHQDWPSIESSLDSLVVWIPLVNVNINNGTLLIWPGSHKNGILPYETIGGFATVNVNYSDKIVQPNLECGDIVIFSTLLVHSSGDILNNTIRWSCHFRYTNMDDEDFINRGYPNPYVYKPITKQ